MNVPSGPSSQSSLPNDVVKFILQHIHSVEQLEVLLLLQSDQQRKWSAAAVNGVVKSDVDSVANRLEDLVSRALVARHTDGNVVAYRFVNSELHTSAVDEICHFYRTHRVSIIELIYSRSNDKIRDFAEAFLIRKKRT